MALFDFLELLMFPLTDKRESRSKSIVAPDNKGPRDLVIYASRAKEKLYN